VHVDLIQGSGFVNGSGNASELVNGGESARGSDEASALPAPWKTHNRIAMDPR
jgi:hypothetical protein